MATIAGGRGGTSSADTGTPASHPYTCNTCQVAFRNIDLQKTHMRGDWHRYNLKRRVASLPAIPSEAYNEKVLQARAASTAQADKVGFGRACDICQKTYFSENSYQNHLGSQKHKANAVARSANGPGPAADETDSVISSTFSLGEPLPTKRNADVEVDSEAEEEFSQVIEGLKKAKIHENSRPSPVKRPSNPHLSAQGNHEKTHRSHEKDESGSGTATPVKTKPAAPIPTLNSCLFCNYESPSPRLNTVHMERIHGMFIPEKDYLVDFEGLLALFQKRVHEFHECIYCGKVKADVFAIQTHMRDTGHCKIPYTTEEEQVEIGEFYDFRSTYSDGEDSEEEEEDDDDDQQGGGGAKLGAKRVSKATDENGDEVMDDGWETDSDASSLDSADLTAVPAEQHYHQYARLSKHPHHTSHDPRGRHQLDGWHSHAHKHRHAAFYDEYELHLPGGKHVGNRAHNVYYRQNMRHYPSPSMRARQELERLEVAGQRPMDVDGAGDGAGLNRVARRQLSGVGGTGIVAEVLGEGADKRGLGPLRRREHLARDLARQRRHPGLEGLSVAEKLAARRTREKDREQEWRSRGKDAFRDWRRSNQQKHFHYSKLGG